MPAIRAAVKVHKRPTAVIMRDDWQGHRRISTGLPIGDREEWTEWDHTLLDVFQTIEDYTDEYGLLVWQREDEAVVIDAKKKIHPFKEAVDQKTTGTDKKPYKAEPGEYFVPDMWSKRKDENGNEVIQTYREWLTREIEAKSDPD